MWERIRNPIVIGGAIVAVVLMWPRVTPLTGEKVKEITYWQPGTEILKARDAIDEFERRCARKGSSINYG